MHTVKFFKVQIRILFVGNRVLFCWLSQEHRRHEKQLSNSGNLIGGSRGSLKASEPVRSQGDLENGFKKKVTLDIAALAQLNTSAGHLPRNREGQGQTHYFFFIFFIYLFIFLLLSFYIFVSNFTIAWLAINFRFLRRMVLLICI